MKKNDLAKPIKSPFEMPRQKTRSLFVSLGYRLTQFGSKFFGGKRLLRLYLNGVWLFWRLAFELATQLHGEKFYFHTRALSEDDLRRLIPENGKFVDIGCGFGEWCRVASKYAETVIGIDYQSKKVEQARAQTNSENVTFLVGDAFEVLGDKKFDVALLSHVIEHIDDADAFLQQLRLLTKTLIIDVPDFETDPLNWVRVKEGCRYYTDNDHVREYTIDFLIIQIERNGWRIKECRRRNGSIMAVAEKL